MNERTMSLRYESGEAAPVVWQWRCLLLARCCFFVLRAAMLCSRIKFPRMHLSVAAVFHANGIIERRNQKIKEKMWCAFTSGIGFDFYEFNSCLIQ